MRKIVRIIAIVMLTASFTACDELANMANQAAQMANLKNCTFNGVKPSKRYGGGVIGHTGLFRDVHFDNVKINGEVVDAPADVLQ